MSASTKSQVVTLTSVKRLRGAFQIPGDKSISHRSALFAALGAGPSRLLNYSSARDCQSTLDCLISLGVPVTVEGTFSRSEVRGKMNGGGQTLTIHTGDGSIRLTKSTT